MPEHDLQHSHSHGVIDPGVFFSQRGIWAVQWSFLGLLATALLQVVVVLLSGSAALLGDTIHNFGDAGTAIPLWIAFMFARLKPSMRFTYGYGRVEDLAGVVIVLAILFSAIYAGYVSISRLFHPQPVEYLGAVIAAAVVGFLGNEAVALFRMRVGREIGSAALVADGYHARADGLTSLAVLLGAIGVWLGFALADPIMGLVISVFILRIAWHSGRTVFARLLDGVEPELVDRIQRAVRRVPEVVETSQVRARWSGYRIHAEVNVAISPELSIEQGHAIAKQVHDAILHELGQPANAVIHIDPLNASGEEHHSSQGHSH